MLRAISKKKIVAELAGHADVGKETVADVLEGLTQLAQRELGPHGPGVFAIPGLVKLKRTRREATKERQSRNPYTGEPLTIAAKPARNMIRASPVKVLKDSI